MLTHEEQGDIEAGTAEGLLKVPVLQNATRSNKGYMNFKGNGGTLNGFLQNININSNRKVSFYGDKLLLLYMFSYNIF
jgi:hypothetical protein